MSKEDIFVAAFLAAAAAMLFILDRALTMALAKDRSIASRLLALSVFTILVTAIATFVFRFGRM